MQKRYNETFPSAWTSINNVNLIRPLLDCFDDVCLLIIGHQVEICEVWNGIFQFKFARDAVDQLVCVVALYGFNYFINVSISTKVTGEIIINALSQLRMCVC